MPGCLVAMDGKHIHIKCSNLSGSNYYDYKVFYGMVLLAVCDSKYCFILHDTGKFGSNNDSGISGKIVSPLAHSGIPDLTENNNQISRHRLLTNHARLILALTFFVGDSR